jgi:hypothetical protein
MVKEIVSCNNIIEKERFKTYSIRIGATTRQHIVGIDHAKILKYIGWSDSRLPSINMRYIRFNVNQLRKVPFEMIHGAMGKSSVQKANLFGNFYDPWDQQIKWKNSKKARKY